MLTGFVVPPQVWTVKPILEARERIEMRQDRDFTSARDNTTEFLTRVRVGAEATDQGKKWTGRFVLQVGNVWRHAPARKNWDMAYDALEMNVGYAHPKAQITLGRQVVRKGDQRFVGPSDWGNKGRSWDALRIQGKQWDAFWGRLGANSVNNSEAWFAFASYAHPYGETMLLRKQDTRPAASVQNYTLSHLISRRFGKLTAKFDGAYQLGRAQNRDQKAFAAVARTTFAAAPGLGVFLEGLIGSGGSSATESHLLDVLYGTNHSAYGWTDSTGLRNLRAYAIGADWQSNKKTLIQAKYNRWHLYDPADGWYSSGGSLNTSGATPMLDATGSSGRYIGDEIGLMATHQYDKRLQFQGGLALFRPGTFPKSILGGTTKNQFWSYLQAQYRF